MHMQGTPQNMQIAPKYPNGVINEIKDFFIERINFLEKNNVGLNRIILDPGIGFGKTTQHNLEILKNIQEFKQLQINSQQLFFPILIGLSQKSFIGKILGSEEKPLPPEERFEGTIILHTYCISKNVDFIRSHDVKHLTSAKKLLTKLI